MKCPACWPFCSLFLSCGLWRKRPLPVEVENQAPTEAGGGSPGWEACRVLVPQASERASSACRGHGPHVRRLLLHPTPTFLSLLLLCSPWLQSPSQAPLPPRSPQESTAQGILWTCLACPACKFSIPIPPSGCESPLLHHLLPSPHPGVCTERCPRGSEMYYYTWLPTALAIFLWMLALGPQCGALESEDSMTVGRGEWRLRLTVCQAPRAGTQ